MHLVITDFSETKQVKQYSSVLTCLTVNGNKSFVMNGLKYWTTIQILFS